MNLPDVRLFLPRRLPVLIPAVTILIIVIAFVPIGLVLQYRASYKTQPRIHLFQDMDNQPRYKAQSSSDVFADGRGMRPRVANTIPRGGAQVDDALYRGYVATGAGAQPDAADIRNATQSPAVAPAGAEPAQPGVAEVSYTDGYPDGLDLTADFIARGQDQYNTFCYPCHGLSGYGNGPVNQRATALQQSTNNNLKLGTVWVPAANLQEVNEDGTIKYGPDLYANGKLYNTINNGKGNMVGYGHAINAEDRWAIVAYIRALQLTQHPDLMADSSDEALRVAER